MKNKILELNKLTTAWLTNVALYGNECASTDRLVESIIKTAKELEIEYDEEVPIITKINKERKQINNIEKKQYVEYINEEE